MRKYISMIFILSMINYIFLLSYNIKEIIKLFKKIPILLVLFNGILLIYKIYFIPHIFSRYGDFGIWLLGMSRSRNLIDVLMDSRAATYFSMIKFFSIIFGGIDFNFVSNLYILLSFLNTFFLYIVVWLLFKDKKVALVSSLFYAISPIIFIFSLTEDYTNLAMFFAIQTLFFLAVFVENKINSFFWLALFSLILTINSRPEYSIFIFIFVLFLWLLNKDIRKSYLLTVVLLVLPKLILTSLEFINGAVTDMPIHVKPARNDYLLYDIFVNHTSIFITNFFKNIATIFNIYTLMGIFIFLAVMIIPSTFIKNKKKILFFIFYYIILFFFYSFCHNEGLYTSYKYIPSLVIPIVILAAVGWRDLFNIHSNIATLSLIFIIIFSLYATSPLAKNKFGFLHYQDPKQGESYKEFAMFRALKYKKGNNFSTMRGHYDIDLGNSSIFISNGNRTYLFSALPIKDDNIYCVYSRGDLAQVIKKIKPESLVYVSQGIWGFEGLTCDNYKSMPSSEFEKEIMESLILDREIFSYYSGKHHVFLYKMTARNIPFS